MLTKFGNFIVRHRWWVIVVWVVAAISIISFSPKLSSVESSNQASFLSDKYESVQAENLAKQIFPTTNDPTNLIVFENTHNTALSSTDQANIQKITQELNAANLPHTVSVVTSPTRLSANGKVQLSQVLYSGDAQSKSVIDSTQNLRDALKTDTAGTGLTANVTGELATSYDTQDSFDNAIKIVSIATIVLILLLPALVFRSVIIGLLPVLAVSLVYMIASSLIAIAAKIFNFEVSQQLSVLFTVVLFGVGTDYILFLLFRYREQLAKGDHSRKAVAFALSRAGEAIFLAALVVISSFVALLFSGFGIFTSFAPGLIIIVATMLIAAVTLIPALVSIIGDKIFWPSKVRAKRDKPTLSKRVGKLVSTHPAKVGGVILAFLILLALGCFWYVADFSSVAQPQPGTESAAGYQEMQSAFPAGALSPTLVYIAANQTLTQSQLQNAMTTLQKTTGVASVLPATVSSNGQDAVINVILQDDPYSSQAMSDVAGPIRSAVHNLPISGQKLVGGTTSSIVDVQSATSHALKVVLPIAAVLILVVLSLLLRSVVAPLYMLVAVGFGFVASLGATVLIFTKLGNQPGIIFFLPIMLYVFVVAIGTDYNVLTITRLREEVKLGGNDPKKATDMTIEHSSATVVSAGIILAGTFLSLLLARISLLTQMGLAIAMGVVLAAFIIAPLLVPAVSTVLGYIVWWPGHRPTKSSKK